MPTGQSEEGRVKKSNKHPFLDGLTKNHFVVYPLDLLLGYPQLDSVDKECYIHLIRFATISIANGNIDEKGNPIVFPSQETLAKLIGVSQSTVSRRIKKLETFGLLEVKRQGLKATNRITMFLPETVREFMQEYSDTDASGISEFPDMHQCISGYAPVHTIYKESNKKEIQNTETPQSSVSEKLDKPSKRKVVSTETPEEILARLQAKKAATAGRIPTQKSNRSALPRPDKRNSATLLKHFSEIYQKKFGKSPPLTTGKDRKLLKDMIEYYGYDKTVEMVDFAVLYFDIFKQDKGIKGLLTIGIIFGFRAYLQERAEMYFSPNDSPETQESSW